MSSPVEILTEKMNTDKEILSVMPQNTKKNREIYIKKVEELKEDYKRYLNDIVLEIKRRANKINNMRQNPEISKTRELLEKYAEVDLFGDLNKPLEKMKLDEKLFDIRRFYKDNLEQVNINIEECLKKIELLGVKIKEEDFKYSPYLRIYMKAFMEEYRNGNVSSSNMKETFEKVYWECPDIIIHIEMNIRYLYFKYRKELDKKFSIENRKQLKELGTSEKTALEDYSLLLQKEDEMERIDKRLLLEKFINKELDPKNFEEASIIKQYDQIIANPISDYSRTELNELKENIVKLSQSLNEYKNYLKYKFIFDKVLKIYNEKEKYKNSYEKQIKEIQKLEGKLFKTNKKYDKLEKKKDSFLHKKKAPEKLKELVGSINSQILVIKDLYRQLYMNKTSDKVATTLTDNSTIYDALLLASAYYTFIVEALMEEFPDIAEEEINEQVINLRNFITNPYITILKNITIKEDKDMALMIRDKYNLLEINVNKESFDEDSLDSFISQVRGVEDAYNFEKSKLSIEDIQFVLKANKLLESIAPEE